MAIVSHLETHISSVRALTCVQSSHDHSTLLFSGGGRASLKVWLIQSDTSESDSIFINFNEICYHSNPRSSQFLTM